MKLDKLFARFEKRPLNLFPGLCSGSRDRKSPCRACADVCPLGLLKVGELGLGREIDLSGCNSCGLCATVCPNGVFDVREPTDIALVNRIKPLLEKREKLTIGCHQGVGKGGEAACDLILTCLGRLHEGIFVAASAMGAREILLLTSACRTCETKGLLSVLTRSVENSRLLLQAFGRETKMVFPEGMTGAGTPEEGKGKKPEETKAEETNERREFLKFLKGRTVSAVATVADCAIDQFKETVSPRKEQAKPAGLEHWVPAKRQILLHFLRTLGRPKLECIDRGTLPLAQVGIREGCDLCGSCSRFCPTGALAATTADGVRGIDFALSLCTGCGLCKVACPEGALSLSDTIETAGLSDDGAKRLICHEVYRCAICGQDFGATGSRKYCRTCERKMKLMNAPL